jgi:hypothetical protein
MPYDGVASGTRGMVEIHAQSIDIGGTLNAAGSGYTGGGGGGGGGASALVWIDHHPYYYFVGPSAGGVADYGEYHSVFQGFMGSMSGYDNFPGGFPGWGDGVYGGWQSGVQDGGYAAPGINGDLSDDDYTTMGCGGGGGSGSDGWVEGSSILHLGYGGGGGGRGGGCIRIHATGAFILRGDSLLDASGFMGGNAIVQTGGNASPPEQGLAGGVPAVNGGKGAGGGILLQLKSAQSATIEQGATIRTLGGNSASANGGTVKIRFNLSGGWSNSGTIIATRICINGVCGSSIADWYAY